MTVPDVMARLEALGSEKTREINRKNGAGENQFGVKMGDLRNVAKEIKIDPELARALWATGNLEAMFLSILISNPKKMSADEVEEWVKTAPTSHVLDWLMTNIVKPHKEKERLRQEWMRIQDPNRSRAGWSLTTERVIKEPTGLDLPKLLDRIEAEMAGAHALPQWTMNYCLAEIGINNPELRSRALAIGEKLGIYRDYPVSKGCTSPFAPIWITEMVKRA